MNEFLIILCILAIGIGVVGIIGAGNMSGEP